HGAGPLVSMFLIPQRLSKVVYVGTTVLVFTWINWIKVPFYCLDRHLVDWAWVPRDAIINRQTLWRSIELLPAVPVGVWLGVWLNKKFSENAFVKVIYALTFLTGAQLVFNFDLTGWLSR
ncbi:MAG: sulfite exporter TauE/SafE family protein, partial [Verrucomicrobiae bacterium]|nr:sulfite exporter TauE/SafE family protein [Verrucomicrobiae bacterium]